MGRRRIDWVTIALIIVTILGAMVHVEHRLASIEQHLQDQDKDNARIHVQLDRIEHDLSR